MISKRIRIIIFSIFALLTLIQIPFIVVPPEEPEVLPEILLKLFMPLFIVSFFLIVDMLYEKYKSERK